MITVPDYAYFAAVAWHCDSPRLILERVEVVKSSATQIQLRRGCWGSHHRTRLPAGEWHRTPEAAVARLLDDYRQNIEGHQANIRKLEEHVALIKGPLPPVTDVVD